MKYQGVPVRIYALVLSPQGEVLVSEKSELPKADFSAGKDFRENLSECLRTQCGVKPVTVKPAAVTREHGADSCMAVAFWVEEVSGQPSPGWKYIVPGALSGFDATLAESCFRTRPAVLVQ